MATIITQPDFTADLQAFLVERPILRQQIFNELSDTTDYFVQNASGETPIMKVRKSGSFLQPSDGSSDWNPLGGIASSVRKLHPKYGKLDMEEDVQKLRDTFLDEYRGKLSDQAEPDLMTFIVDFLKKGIAEEIGLGMWQGLGHDMAATTNHHLYIAKGFLKIIVDEITAGEISAGNGNLIATGAITEANILDKVKAMYAAVPAKYKAGPLDLFLSPTLKFWYEEAYKLAFGTVVYTAGYNQPKTPYGNITIKDKWQMGDSERMIMSTPKNLCIGVRDMLTNQTINVKDYKPRAVSVWADIAYDVNFAALDEIWVNNRP